MTHLLHTEAVARLLGLSASTLRKMRSRGEGPAFVRIGRRSIRYRPADVEAYVAGASKKR